MMRPGTPAEILDHSWSFPGSKGRDVLDGASQIHAPDERYKYQPLQHREVLQVLHPGSPDHPAVFSTCHCSYGLFSPYLLIHGVHHTSNHFSS
ncbi:MAG: hypothetical protein GF308_05845 [Candidatus Heimdallarchaeota archaeon]|nr:hypothetical protein [Candidatus Heimdallarchaeota archaeon]